MQQENETATEQSSPEQAAPPTEDAAQDGPSFRDRAWAGLKFHWPMVLVTVLGLLFTAGLAIHVEPWRVGDSVSYIHYAERLLDIGKMYSFHRTPGYPATVAAFLWLWEESGLEALVNFQMLLAMVRIPCLYWVLWQITRRRWIAALSCLLPLTSFEVWMWDSCVMTESIFTTGLCLLLAMAPGLVLRPRIMNTSLFVLLLTGLMLYRPVSQHLGILVGLLLLLYLVFSWKRRTDRRYVAGAGLACLFLPYLLLLPLMIGHQRDYGYFGLTYMGPFAMTQRTGERYEDLPDRYAGIRDLYLEEKYELGTHVGAIHQVRSSIQSQHRDPEEYVHAMVNLLKQLEEPNRYLLTADPLWVVVRGWQGMELLPSFLAARPYQQAESFREYTESSPVYNTLFQAGRLLYGERRLLRVLAPYLLVAGALYLVFKVRKLDRTLWVLLPLLITGYLAMVSSAVIPEAYERYRIPLMPFALGLAGAIVLFLLEAQIRILARLFRRDPQAQWKRRTLAALRAVVALALIVTMAWLVYVSKWKDQRWFLTAAVQEAYGAWSLPRIDPRIDPGVNRINLESLVRSRPWYQPLQAHGYYVGMNRPESLTVPALRLAPGRYQVVVYMNQWVVSDYANRAVLMVQDAGTKEALAESGTGLVHGKEVERLESPTFSLEQEREVVIDLSWAQGPQVEQENRNLAPIARVLRVEIHAETTEPPLETP